MCIPGGCNQCCLIKPVLGRRGEITGTALTDGTILSNPPALGVIKSKCLQGWSWCLHMARERSPKANLYSELQAEIKGMTVEKRLFSSFNKEKKAVVSKWNQDYIQL